MIKQYPCESKDELKSEEARFIRCLKPIGNFQIPMRTKKEYCIENIEIKKVYDKQYYIDNIEIKKVQNKQYIINNKAKLEQNAKQIITCCCGKTYTHQHRLQHCRSNKHKNNITVQFELITKLHNELQNRPPIPDLSNLLLV